MTTPNKTAEPPKQEVAKKESAMVEIVPHGSREAFKLSVAMVKTMLAVKTKKGFFPTNDDCVKFIALCQARKLNPFEGDAYMIGYDTDDGPKFNLITAHQAFLKRAEVHKEFNGMKSGIIVERKGQLIDLEGDFHLEDDKVVGGWACVFFKTRAQPMMKRVRLKRFQKSYGIWRDDPAGMICKCAEADALRSSFPTLCGGMYMKEEYRDDVQPTGMATPLFKPTPPGAPMLEEGDADAADEEAARNSEPPLSPQERLRVLCTESDIEEADLIAFLQTVELADDNAEKIDDLSAEDAEAALERWEDVDKQIKEVISKQKP